MSRCRILQVVVVGILLAASLALAVNICGSCGYEAAENDVFCSHCGARLAQEVKPSETPNAQSNQESPGVDEAPGVLNVELVKADMRTAQSFYEEKQFELAHLFARNALALNPVVGVDAGAERSKAIISFIDRCKHYMGVVQHGCPVCGGTGKGVLTTHALDGKSHEFRGVGQNCNRCGGRGKIQGKETTDERRFRQGKANERYRTLRQSAGQVPVGLVWLPSNIASGLTVKQKVAFKRAIPPSCERCAGLGRVDCSVCKGGGNIPCRGKGCDNGWVEVEHSSKLKGSKLGDSSLSGIKSKCSSCQGTGKVPCKRCNGEGSFVCKGCNGSGLANRCSRCSALGCIECRRCKGAGVLDAKTCDRCHGEKIEECSYCSGAGRKQ